MATKTPIKQTGKRKAGRPSTGDGDAEIHIRIASETRDWLNETARDQGTQVSAIVREAIKNYRETVRKREARAAARHAKTVEQEAMDRLKASLAKLMSR